MQHNDKIKDTDAYFEVDAITRQITNRTPAKIVLMQGDHNSERFTFSLPRFIEGHDMAESASAKLHYINASQNIEGMYSMNDLQIDPVDTEKVICSWLISGNVTAQPGKISFLIEFECYEGNVLVYSWHTMPHTSISIGEGFECSEEIAEQYADILAQWEQRINAAIGKAGALESGTGTNSVQQTPETESWSPVNERATEFLQKKNYKTEDGAEVQRDAKGNYKVGAFGKNSAMFGAKSQTVGGKTFVAGSKCIAFENNATALGNGSFAGGKHSLAAGNEAAALGNAAVATGGNTVAEGDHSSAGGFETEAIGMGADATGKKTKAKGDYSEASGVLGEANGFGAHKEGGNNISEGDYSHTEGSETIAGNVNAHGEGHMCFAYGEQSHAQGNKTIAGISGYNITGWTDSGDIYITVDSIKGLEIGDVVSIITDSVYLDCATIKNLWGSTVTLSSEFAPIYDRGLARDSSGNVIQNKLVNTLFIRKKPSLGTKVVGHHTHSGGYGTVAASDCQCVQGKFNKIDTDDKYLDIVGNGTDNENRSNAYTLDKDGNAWFSGDVECNGLILKSPDGKRFKIAVGSNGALTTTQI